MSQVTNSKTKKSWVTTNSKNKSEKTEKIIKFVLIIFSAISIFTTLAIVVTLLSETFQFFTEVSIIEFFTSFTWSPTLVPQNFGIIPLITGTLIIAVGASIVALPIGLGTAIYLSEYAKPKVRKILKPALELLAGIPSIVYGFFALNYITPMLKHVFPSIEVFNALSASIAVGIMILPMVASLCEDALMSVPDSVRKGAYALGANKFEVITTVVIPSAFSGIVSSFVLAISRAMGETMIVAIAAGQSPIFTLNPLDSIQTLTGFMVNISMGDIAQGTLEYNTIFAVGMVLFTMTLFMNVVANLVVRKNRRRMKGAK